MNGKFQKLRNDTPHHKRLKDTLRRRLTDVISNAPSRGTVQRTFSHATVPHRGSHLHRGVEDLIGGHVGVDQEGGACVGKQQAQQGGQRRHTAPHAGWRRSKYR